MKPSMPVPAPCNELPPGLIAVQIEDGRLTGYFTEEPVAAECVHCRQDWMPGRCGAQAAQPGMGWRN